jgi:hypothetical protein
LGGNIKSAGILVLLEMVHKTNAITALTKMPFYTNNVALGEGKRNSAVY